MKSKSSLVWLVASLLLILTSCISLNTNVANNSIATTDYLQTYPIKKITTETDLNASLYPIIFPTQESMSAYAGTPITIPTPAIGKSVFFGQMLTPGIGGKPYVGDIFLAGLVHANEANQPPLIKFSEEQSPKAVVNSLGQFYFEGVNPGEYALLVYSLGGTYIINDHNGQTLLVLAEAGSSVDLGVVEIP